MRLTALMKVSKFMVLAIGILLVSPDVLAQKRILKSTVISPISKSDLSDTNCPKDWKIVVLNLGMNGFNCESPSCSCHDSSKAKCIDTEKKLREVRLPEGANWECVIAPAGCIWCGPK